MRQTLREYGYKLSKVPLLCDNESAICWGEGEDATLRSRPSSTRYTNGGKMTGVAHPSSSSLQDEGL
jgi:hypothetical protein